MKAREGRKFLLVSMKLGKIAEGTKVQTTWGKVELMGRKSGVPNAAREQDFRLRYRP